MPCQYFSCRSESSFNAWSIRQILACHIGTEDATKKNMPFYLLQLTGEINIKHPILKTNVFSVQITAIFYHDQGQRERRTPLTKIMRLSYPHLG